MVLFLPVGLFINYELGGRVGKLEGGHYFLGIPVVGHLF